MVNIKTSSLHFTSSTPNLPTVVPSLYPFNSWPQYLNIYSFLFKPPASDITWKAELRQSHEVYIFGDTDVLSEPSSSLFSSSSFPSCSRVAGRRCRPLPLLFDERASCLDRSAEGPVALGVPSMLFAYEGRHVHVKHLGVQQDVGQTTSLLGRLAQRYIQMSFAGRAHTDGYECSCFRMLLNKKEPLHYSLSVWL